MTIGISFGSSLLFFQLPGVKRVTASVGLPFIHAFANVFWTATVISAVALVIVLVRYLGSRRKPAAAKESA